MDICIYYGTALVGRGTNRMTVNRHLHNPIREIGGAPVAWNIPAEETVDLSRVIFYRNPNELLGAEFVIRVTYDEPRTNPMTGMPDVTLGRQDHEQVFTGCWLVEYSELHDISVDSVVAENVKFIVRLHLDNNPGNLCMSLPGEKDQEIIEWEERWSARRSR